MSYFLEVCAVAVGKKSKATFCDAVVFAGVFRKQRWQFARRLTSIAWTLFQYSNEGEFSDNINEMF